ncbi:hypothetical protein OG311_17085 [Streptomyces sp. NBC_01343]|uniref:hypothetical protein n=1 Tax=Streptomyces sp. NBC_01343 TaxID=2903832 RepID=UPI002E1673BD|nr:hypothetical protein OG311_17085 [Streptomyces sp. NBC_01343]
MPDPVDFVARLRREGQDPGREEALRQDRLRRMRRRILGAGAAVALAGVITWAVASALGERPDDEPYAPGLLEEAMWPAEWPATTNMPFRGSPAAAWATSGQDLELPQAEAVGPIPSPVVGDGLRRVREFLTAADMDPAVLDGGLPAKALDLLDPGHPATAALAEHLRNPGAPNTDALELFTRFDPESLTLTDRGLRAHGRMTYEAAPDSAADGVPQQVRIHADYTFAYALRRTGDPEPGPTGDTEEVTRVVVRRHMVLDFDPTTGKLAPVEYRRQLANHDCGAAADGFVHPYFSKEAKRAHRPWPVADPYEEAGDIGAGVPACTVPTRT